MEATVLIMILWQGRYVKAEDKFIVQGFFVSGTNTVAVVMKLMAQLPRQRNQRSVFITYRKGESLDLCQKKFLKIMDSIYPIKYM